MFSFKDFVKSGLLKAVGKMADYQVILNAAGWLEKGVLDETDLAEIDAAINAQYPTEQEETSDTLEKGVISEEQFKKIIGESGDYSNG